MPDKRLPQTSLAQDVRPVAERYVKADVLLIRGLNKITDSLASGGLPDLFPDSVKLAVSDAIEVSLKRVYDLAEFTPPSGGGSTRREGLGPKLLEALKLHKHPKCNQAAAVIVGGFGGAGGPLATIAELPVTIGLIFREIQQVSKQYGRDPASETAKRECLAVFVARTPLEKYEELEFWSIVAQFAMEGAINDLISRITPQLLRVLVPKLASPPAVGAVVGAGLNYVHINYYRELAHVNFQLDGLAQIHGSANVVEEFKRQAS